MTLRCRFWTILRRVACRRNRSDSIKLAYTVYGGPASHCVWCHRADVHVHVPVVVLVHIRVHARVNARVHVYLHVCVRARVHTCALVLFSMDMDIDRRVA
jgi:hypothetical protein